MNNKNKFISLLFILLSLFVLVFFTQDYYSNFVWLSDELAKKQEIQKQKSKKLNDLWIIKKDLEKQLKSSDSTKKTNITKFIEQLSNNPSEDNLINEIYSSIYQSTTSWDAKILSLSMSKWQKNELGFYEKNINITARFSSKKALLDYVDYLTHKSKFKFYIKNLNISNIKNEEYFNASIPLVLFYVKK